ncbi:MAG: penicillin acylase family protein, partial [Gammaproteobacteria bacterium]
MKLLGRGISLLALLLVVVSVDVRPAAGKTEEGLASSVTIFRDTYGVPHVDAPTDAGVLYGWAYAQAEDYFWQVEDSYIMALGRYAEVQGEDGLENDLLNRTFDVVPRARAAYDLLDSEMRTLV